MYPYIKRALDIFFSIFLLIALSPFFLLATLLILLFMGGPVIYSQKRVGRHNKQFVIYKFRTMKIKTFDHQIDFDRITWVGRLLRLSRLDEFPQLYNILKGDMSFIGPRPLIPDYLPYYTKEELRRHEVRPGLSGLSQVDTESYPKWETQFEKDIKYIETQSFLLDCVILFKTFIRVLTPSQKLIVGLSGRERLDEYRNKKQNTTQI